MISRILIITWLIASALIGCSGLRTSQPDVPALKFAEATYYEPRSLHELHQTHKDVIFNWAPDARLISAEFGIGEKLDFYLIYASPTIGGTLQIFDLGDDQVEVFIGSGPSIFGPEIGVDPESILDSTEIFKTFFGLGMLSLELRRIQLESNCSSLKLGYGLTEDVINTDVDPSEVLSWRLNISDCESFYVLRAWRSTDGRELYPHWKTR